MTYTEIALAFMDFNIKRSSENINTAYKLKAENPSYSLPYIIQLYRGCFI